MKKIIAILILLFNLDAFTQDVIFSQSFLVPETLNSSFTGAIRTTKAGAINRTQWRSLGLTTDTKYAYIDTWLEGFKTGVGISFLNHTENNSNYTFNQINANYAMSFQISNTWFFRPSISAGFGMKSFGFQTLLLEDQINLNTNIINTSSIDPVLLNEQRNFFDISSSILFNNENSWVGLTLKHLNNPNISLTENGNAPLDIFMTLHTKYYLPLFQKNPTWFSEKSKIYFLSNFMIQGAYNKLDIGGQYIFDDRISIGVTAGTTPIKTTENNSLIASVNTFIGVKWQGFRFGYSYDFNTTDILNANGTSEFSISYDFSLSQRTLDRFKCVSYF